MIRSLHHVTATVNDAQEDLDFYAGVLGQRLVKKTVNFDNNGVYHFYYGNETGTPGTIMTTFPYKGMGVRVGTKGAGQINVTSFSVPAVALDFWRARLRDAAVPFDDGTTDAGEAALTMRDPSDLHIRIVGTDDDDRTPWTRPDLGADVAIRGIHSVQLHVREPALTIEFLTRMMDAVVIPWNDRAGAHTRTSQVRPPVVRLGIGAAKPGQVVEVVNAMGAPQAVNGLGTVHHVAFAVATGEEQLSMRELLLSAGCNVTEVRDRQYFTSIYFREPNGILFEIATLPPGFIVDEPLESLGRDLKLPPWEEPHRASIESRLPVVTY
jgi:glyoxalase family protein